MSAAAVLVVAEDAAAAALIPGVDGPKLTALLEAQAMSFAARVAPEQMLTVAAGAGDGARRGERIASAAASALATFGGPLLIASAAFPGLRPAHARAALADFDAGCELVIGPSTTGDWFLLGVRTSQPALLESLRAGAAGSETLRAAALAGLRIGMLGSERPLRSAADADALRADPLTAPELLAALGGAPNSM